MESATPALDQLQESVNTWVGEQLKGYVPRPVDSNKILREPVWGMTVLYPLEIAILDSPIVQRLRQIHQTGLVFLTFPSALHTRFDHTLGMIHCTAKITSAINSRYLSIAEQAPFTEKDIQEIRLAAILHDVGHTCLSHLTEPYFSDHPLMKHSKLELSQVKKVIPSNHEIISRLIVKSNAFINFFDMCIKATVPGQVRLRDAAVTCNNIADMIIGAPIGDNPSDSYKTEVVNGAFDADKLDYIFRDSYFTGISLGTDVDRFVFGLSLDDLPIPDRRRGIVLDINAASSYDQLVLSKASLYINVYNHQKVMATNILVDQILRMLKDDTSIRIAGVSTENPLNFLSLADWDLLKGDCSNKEIKKIQKKLQQRDLPVRLFRISRKTVDTPDLPVKIIKVVDDDNARNNLRELICRGIGAPLTGCNTLQVSLPDKYSLPEMTNAFCRDFDGEIISFNEVSPLQWVETYRSNKWMGYVFGPSIHEKEETFEKIKGILEKELDTFFNSKSAPKYYKGGKHAVQSQ